MSDSDAEEDYDSDNSNSCVTFNEEDLHPLFGDDTFEEDAHLYSRWTVY